METHVLHHYVSTIPFYNADQATEAIKGVMGRHYQSAKIEGLFDFVRTIYRNVRSCEWVEQSSGAQGEGKDIVFFRNRNGLGVKPLNLHFKTE